MKRMEKRQLQPDFERREPNFMLGYKNHHRSTACKQSYDVCLFQYTSKMRRQRKRSSRAEEAM